MMYFTIITGTAMKNRRKLYVMRGSKVEEVKELHAGDIGALAKLAKTLTTDSLHQKYAGYIS